MKQKSIMLEFSIRCDARRHRRYMRRAWREIVKEGVDISYPLSKLHTEARRTKLHRVYRSSVVTECGLKTFRVFRAEQGRLRRLPKTHRVKVISHLKCNVGSYGFVVTEN